MKVNYDAHTDSLIVVLRDDAVVLESDEDKPGMILDYDADGNLIAIEILDASRRVTDARRIEYQTSG
jgi:YD repeat-containing protein